MSNNEMNHLPWQAVYEELGIGPSAFDDRPLGAYVEEHARMRPDHIAMQYGDAGISYADLNGLASRLANALVAMGIGKGDVVGIHLPNIPQYVIALVAISKIGCAGSGVSPLLSPPELAHQIADAGIRVVITLDKLAPAYTRLDPLPSTLETIIVAGAADHLTDKPAPVPEGMPCRCEPYLDLLAHCDDAFRQCDVHWDDTFMVQYTGGTTGRPKGAQLSVRNLLHNPVQYGCYEPWAVGSEVVCTAFPMFHVAGLSYAIAALRVAAMFLLIPDPRDVEFFSRQMVTFPPTRMGAVPTLYQMLLGCPTFRQIDFSRLKTAVTGAAPMTIDGLTALEAVIGKQKITDLFGMTETSPAHVCHPHTRYKPGAVGIPVPGAETRIVDVETGTREMAPGEVGEIITTGPQVMKGYLNQPQESAKAIRQWRGQRWMYTGDVGYMDDQGYIYVCDRVKDMLIVGGYKVFSIELEEKITQLPFVAAAAVVGTPDADRPGNDIVTLYIQLIPGHPDTDAETAKQRIVDFSRENMAPYKVPKIIHVVKQIPMTSVGKLDKKVLRQKLAHVG